MFKSIKFSIVLFFSFLNACTLFSQTEQKTGVIAANKEIFQKNIYDYEKNPNQLALESELPCLIDFYTTWCGPCKMIAPILEELANEYKGKVAFYKIDAEKEREIAGMFRVTSYPTIIFWNKSGEILPLPGARSKEEFKLWIDATLLKDPEAMARLNAVIQQREEAQFAVHNTNIVMLDKADFLKNVYNYEKNPGKWVYEGSLPCIIDFCVDKLEPCGNIAPLLNQLAGEYKGKIIIYKVDLEKNPELAQQFQIDRVPLLFFCPVGEDKQAHLGAMSKDEFKLLVDAVLLKNPQAVAQLKAQQQQAQQQAKQQASQNTNIVMLDKATFLKKVYNYEKNPDKWVYEGSLPCIIDFYADWCGPCRMIAPFLNELAGEYKGKIVIYKVDTQKQPELAQQFQVRNLPTLYFCTKNGDKQVFMGARSKEEFKQMIDTILLKK